ncbi:MAG: hypothetical protein UT34_C0002G0057 [candidate division WS6 bacterium GW2011_GWF2_39_15]|uniref:Uncharacterized protein n=1 Tax=candidate division WS6 bacterium GW2011_GWF2_39_15 TaxID=1619100 RepID=A0A0G0Q561_9BACT|nr:MAG: hypothetical protein UT34_C0002G0057 [candidate division WS6 bacterium GW2011_GWF2_39_15]
MKVRGKNYNVIIWDWLWTLYSRKERSLYDWVKEYFEMHGKETTNFLVSFANEPEKRKKLIEKHEMVKYFKDMIIERGNKKDMIGRLIGKYNLEKSSILIVGDNVAHEGVAAGELGIDFMHIRDWKKFLSDDLGFRSK